MIAMMINVTGEAREAGEWRCLSLVSPGHFTENRRNTAVVRTQ